MIDEMRATPEKRRDGWYARVTVNGKKKRKRIGPLDDATEQATKDFCEAWKRRGRRRELWEDGATQPLPCSEALPAWLATYGPTMSKRTAKSAASRVAILVSFLGAKDFREFTESDARNFCAAKLPDYSGKTLEVCLLILRRALNVAVQDRIITEHPIPTLHRVMKDVADQGRSEIQSRDAWAREEADKIVALGRKKSHALGHALFVLFQTGCRRGEMLTLAPVAGRGLFPRKALDPAHG